MNTLLDTLLLSLPVWFNVLILSSLKGTIVLLAVGLTAAALRSASASLRHWIWSLVLGAMLFLPALGLVMPVWSVETGLSVMTGAPGAVQERLPAAVEKTASATSASVPAAKEAAPSSLALLTETSQLHWLVWVWSAGAALTLCYYLVGTLRVRRLYRTAESVTDPDVKALAQDVAAQLGVSGPVQLVWSEHTTMPMAWGILDQCVLLPREAAAWSRERRRAVLLHEMVHLSRRDPLTQVVAQAACLFHWFNPTVWWAARQLRVERERACDDRVLRHGLKPSAYAGHLLGIAQALAGQPGRPLAAVSMARPSQLEGRIRALLEPDMNRNRVSSLHSLFIAVAGVVLLLPLAAVTPGSAVSSAAVPFQQQITPTGPVLQRDSSTMTLRTNDYTMKAPGSSMPASRSAASPTVDTIQRTFQVQQGGRLTLQTDRGSIKVTSGQGSTLRIAVRREGAAEEQFEVDFEKRGGDVYVEGRTSSQNNWGSDGSVHYTVTVPRRYNVDLQTAGGGISVGDLEGEVMVQTAGGSLRLGQIQGTVRGKTAGGSIELISSSGNVTLQTAGGSIDVGEVGGSVEARTAGGSISMGTVRGTVKARTSGGSITIEGGGGQINARTSGGSIKARITRPLQGPSRLQTSAGSITVRLGGEVGANLDARTSFGRVVTNFAGSSEEVLETAVNGGGPPLVLRTSVGKIGVQTD